MMKLKLFAFGLAAAWTSTPMYACDCKKYETDDFKIVSTQGSYHADSDSVILSIQVAGKAGKTKPVPAGKLDGAPVLGYVFPTSLKSADIGFPATNGIVALALTSHPDFDDSPIWDENGDGVYDNDGRMWHSHWVILEKDERVEGGLAVKEFDKGEPTPKLPPTSPGMPMFMDSPGFTVIAKKDLIRVIIPSARIKNKKSFRFDGVACFMEVNTTDMMMPMLGVMKVYSVASGDLSLPYKVRTRTR